jgi:hypothetical protein
MEAAAPKVKTLSDAQKKEIAELNKQWKEQWERINSLGNKIVVPCQEGLQRFQPEARAAGYFDVGLWKEKQDKKP